MHLQFAVVFSTVTVYNVMVLCYLVLYVLLVLFSSLFLPASGMVGQAPQVGCRIGEGPAVSHNHWGPPLREDTTASHLPPRPKRPFSSAAAGLPHEQICYMLGMLLSKATTVTVFRW